MYEFLSNMTFEVTRIAKRSDVGFTVDLYSLPIPNTDRDHLNGEILLRLPSVKELQVGERYIVSLTPTNR